MRFEDYWENYGELHASTCGGNIKQFAKEIWMSANVNTEELKEAAFALVQRLELDKDVKKNNWWLNERAKIMEVIDDIESDSMRGC
jgi:hypothetical protein